MEQSEADHSRLRETINEAALEPDRWLDVLTMLGNLTGCIAGGLTIEDTRTRTGSPIAYYGFDPDHVAKTWHHYLPMNPLFAIAPRLQPGVVVTNSMVVAPAAFARTEFYDGWARPQNIGCPVTLVLSRSEAAYIPLTLVRPDGHGDVDADGLAMLTRLAPALTKAFGVTMRLQQVTSREHSILGLMGHLPNGVILLDRNRRVVFANPAAETILRDGRILSLHDGALAARAQSDPALQAALAGTTASKPSAEVTQTVLRGEDGRSILASVVPVGDASQSFAGEGRIVCAVILNRATTAGPDLQSVSAGFNLTPAETRLLGAMLAGHDVASAATALEVTRNTARTHLRAIFSKMQVHRQSDMIRLATSAGPLLQRGK